MAVQQYSCHYSSKGGAGGDIDAPASSASASHWHPSGLLLVAFGLLLLYGAYQNTRKLRALTSSPIRAIRDVTSGLVHVVGNAVGAQPLTSPLTHRTCFYYEVLVEKWVQSGGGHNQSQWSMCLRHIDYTQFYLQDATGKVAVDLRGAQLDLTQVFERVLEPKLGPISIGGTGPSSDALREYLEQTNAQILAQIAERRESLAHALAQAQGSVSLLPANFSVRESGLRLQFREICLLADQQYNVLGTCFEPANPSADGGIKAIARGPKQNSFVISGNPEAVLEQQTRRGVNLLLAIGGVLTALGIFVFVR